MVKGFRLRLSLSSIRMCRSWHPSLFPGSPSAAMPSPVNHKVFDISYPKLIATPDPPPSTPNHPKNSSKIAPIGSGCVSRLSSIPESNTNSPAFPKLFNSPVVEELEKSVWSVEANENSNGNVDPFLTSFSMSFSSAELGGGWLSSDQDIIGDNKSESFSGFDSSCDFGYSLKTINEAKAYEIKRRNKTPNSGEKMDKSPEDDDDGEMTASPEGKKTVFEKLMPCMVEGKVNESYAVMKKSEDPYEDFKKSMMEMIMEKQISEAEDLEKLLMCFLSLNAKDHHHVIVQAFSQVWEELFFSKS